MNFAWPDPLMQDRFYTATLIYGEKEPIVFLIDADCKGDPREMIMYDLDEPETALPAVDAFGEQVVAPNGKTYRRFPQSKNIASPSEWLHSFCDTDWTSEMTAIRAARTKK